MRKGICGISVLALLLGALFAPGGTKEATAAVGININIGPPPRYVIPAPPPVVVIPGTYVYAVPDIDVDILFYQGYWYRPHQGYWFRARSYNGPWVYLAPPQVPRVLIELPPDYRRPPPGYRRIPYGQFKKNWGAWDRQRYWDRDKEWRTEEELLNPAWHDLAAGEVEHRLVGLQNLSQRLLKFVESLLRALADATLFDTFTVRESRVFAHEDAIIRRKAYGLIRMDRDLAGRHGDLHQKGFVELQLAGILCRILKHRNVDHPAHLPFCYRWDCLSNCLR